MAHPARRKLRVLVTRCWGLGGGQVWAHEFSNRLARLGLEVQVIFLRKWWPGRGTGIERDTSSAPKAQYQAVLLNAPLFFEGARLKSFLSAHISRAAADVIVSTGAEGAWLNSAQASGGAPHVASFHHPLAHWVGVRHLLMAGTNLTRRGMARTYKLWDEYLERISMNRADLVICSSQDQACRVVNNLRIPSPKVKMIYYGIDTDRFFSLTSRRESLDRNILYAGGPCPSKGIDVLLEAFAKIRPRFPDARISLVGAGDWTPYEMKIKALGLSDHVHNYGHVSHEDIGRLYRTACLLAAPSRHESFGLVLGEAMACGLPVIATNITAIPEVVVDGVTGLLVPVDDCVALANALEELLGDPPRAAGLGEAGRARVEEHFAWDRIICQWERLLLQLVNGDVA